MLRAAIEQERAGLAQRDEEVRLLRRYRHPDMSAVRDSLAPPPAPEPRVEPSRSALTERPPTRRVSRRERARDASLAVSRIGALDNYTMWELLAHILLRVLYPIVEVLQSVDRLP